MNLNRNFQELVDKRLVKRGNKIYHDLFSNSIHSIRQFCISESDAKGAYRFLSNKRVSEADIIKNHQSNCISGCIGKYVVCIQDTTEINLIKHNKRIKHDESIGTTNSKSDTGLGFLIHPSLVMDAHTGVPYGYSAIKIWNRPLELNNKFERKYTSLPIEEKESYKWIEVSKQTQETLEDVVQGILIIQDREGDIYQQFASIPNDKTDLLVRARSNRTLVDKTKLFTCLENQQTQGEYNIEIQSCSKTKRKKRTATLEVKFKEIEIKNSDRTSKLDKKTTKLYLIEAKEINYTGKDTICWRLLTTIAVTDFDTALNCIEWYSWRWTIEEVFKILKKEGFNIEASELETGTAIRKLSLMIMEVVIKLFLMRIAYEQPELQLEASTCFSQTEQECLEYQIEKLEGKTEKQKNPYQKEQLNRYAWCIARMGGWKGYDKQRKPGITTLWIGLKKFKTLMEGWELHKFVYTR
jgi:Transposase DNA-binding/Transposase DDE domain